LYQALSLETELDKYGKKTRAKPKLTKCPRENAGRNGQPNSAKKITGEA